ncbi:hypothetical protein [Thalassoglobus neptunius]|uniref:hypothetical protein n=1 Tax=Thalassoglobus neptunius TaxID=1938619 RepID=UPI0011B35B37|nr:hypothetical protein [Thalassoglobus neptunius]
MTSRFAISGRIAEFDESEALRLPLAKLTFRRRNGFSIFIHETLYGGVETIFDSTQGSHFD